MDDETSHLHLALRPLVNKYAPAKSISTSRAPYQSIAAQLSSGLGTLIGLNHPSFDVSQPYSSFRGASQTPKFVKVIKKRLLSLVPVDTTDADEPPLKRKRAGNFSLFSPSSKSSKDLPQLGISPPDDPVALIGGTFDGDYNDPESPATKRPHVTPGSHSGTSELHPVSASELTGKPPATPLTTTKANTAKATKQRHRPAIKPILTDATNRAAKSFWPEGLGSAGLPLVDPSKHDGHAAVDPFGLKLSGIGHYLIERERIEFLSDTAQARGGFGDVRKARLLQPSGTAPPSEGLLVAVKQIKFGAPATSSETQKKFVREALVWARLSHDNIIRFIGYHFDDTRREAWLICPWQHNGNVREFIRKKGCSIEQRLRLIMDTIEGLRHLHRQEPPIIHGDIKAANVLVSASGSAMLCDFGLSSDGVDNVLTPGDSPGSYRWCAPELLGSGSSEPQRTKASDVWAWAWLVWEIMTETKPFQECLSEIAVAMALHKNKFVLPTLHEVKAFRNIGFLTKLVLQCWERDPIKRPTIVTCPEEVTLGIEQWPRG